MKALRLVLVLLLVVVLPVRSAVAAAMACGVAGNTLVTAAAANAGDHAPSRCHEVAASDLPSPAQDGDASTDGRSGQPTCHLCASGCHAGAPGISPPAVRSPTVAAAPGFPATTSAPQAYIADGPERPPRTA